MLELLAADLIAAGAPPGVADCMIAEIMPDMLETVAEAVRNAALAGDWGLLAGAVRDEADRGG